MGKKTPKGYFGNCGQKPQNYQNAPLTHHKITKLSKSIVHQERSLGLKFHKIWTSFDLLNHEISENFKKN